MSERISTISPAQMEDIASGANPAPDIPDDADIDVSVVLQEPQILEVLQKFDEELVGLQSVKTRIREIAAFMSVKGTW